MQASLDLTTATFPAPREFQAKANNAVRDGRRAGHKNQLLAAPTGAGKTYLGLLFCHQALQKGRRATFLCDRVTLIDQTSAAAEKYGLGEHGIIQASNPRYNPNLPFQIASAQTIASRGWHETDLIIVDEAHTQLSAWTAHITETKATVVGLSATPFSKGLGRMFTNLVNAATMNDLVEQGVLVPMRIVSGVRADMTGAATSGGEWTDSAAAERGMEIVGDVVEAWTMHGQGRKTICFGATIAHCLEICAQFVQAGVMAAVFTSKTPDAERKRLHKEFSKPDSAVKILISVEALAKGFDVPDVGCVIDCRPLRKSLSTFIQMIGRGARSHPGKSDFILIDHSGNIRRFMEDFSEVYYQGVQSLDDGEKLDSKIRKEPEDGDRPVVKCPKCGFSPFFRRCMACGHEKETTPTKEHVPGVMEEIRLKKGGPAFEPEKLYQELVAYARAYSKPDKQKWRAKYLFQDIAGQPLPPHFNPERVPADATYSDAVANKIRSINIKRANSGHWRRP